MANNIGPGGQPKGTVLLAEGLWKNNPIAIQVLGICSSLAVTGKLENSLVMGGALIFVTAMSNLLVSLLRNSIPRRIRMIVEVAVISAFVIAFDQFLKGFYWSMSKQMGPYVGLIITNCIVMGRAEAFAIANKPLPAIIDGAANGLGYAVVLACVGTIREVLGHGTLLGMPVAGEWYTRNLLLVLPPGAFFVLGFLIALQAWLSPRPEETKP